jgi:hypothetical protein
MWQRSGTISGCPHNAVPLRCPPPHRRRCFRRCWPRPKSPHHHRPLHHCDRMPRRCSSSRPSPLPHRCSSSRRNPSFRPSPLLRRCSSSRRSPLCHCCHRYRRSTLRRRPSPSYPRNLRPCPRRRRSPFRPSTSVHRPGSRRRAKMPWCCCYSRCRRTATRSQRSSTTKRYGAASSREYPRGGPARTTRKPQGRLAHVSRHTRCCERTHFALRAAANQDLLDFCARKCNTREIRKEIAINQTCLLARPSRPCPMPAATYRRAHDHRMRDLVCEERDPRLFHHLGVPHLETIAMNGAMTIGWSAAPKRFNRPDFQPNVENSDRAQRDRFAALRVDCLQPRAWQTVSWACS